MNKQRETKGLCQLLLEAPIQILEIKAILKEAMWNFKLEGEVGIRRKKGQWLRIEEIRSIKSPVQGKYKHFHKARG